MNVAQAEEEHNRKAYQRARRHDQRIPGMDILYLPELSGPDGEHITLFPDAQHTAEDVAKAKHIARNSWDVTGFTITRIKPEWKQSL